MNPYTESEQESEFRQEFTAEERVRQVLQSGEKVLWIGSPATHHFLVLFIVLSILGSILLLFASFFLGMLLWGAIHGLLPGTNHSFLIGGVPALFFMVLGFKLVLSPWTSSRRLRKVVYAVTNQRGLALTDGDSFWFGNPVKTRAARTTQDGGSLWFLNPVETAAAAMTQIDFTPDEMLHRELKRVVGFGRVDLIFATETRKGGKGSYTVHLGFLGLEDPQEVEELIERTFGRPFKYRKASGG